MENIKIWIGLIGEQVGLFLIALVSLYDVLISGMRGFFEYSICYKGITTIWIGVVLIVLSKYWQKRV